jgi:predicted  nucleic acid-binding Zn ribbon protein
MIWENLKHNKCPKCGENLNIKDYLYFAFIKCDYCDFIISAGKYLDIRTDMVTKALE